VAIPVYDLQRNVADSNNMLALNMHVHAVKWDPGHWQVWKFYHPLQLGYK
jgi:hypothetical protein